MDLAEKERPRGGERDPTKMFARRARANTTVLYMAGFYRTPYARADGRNLCAEIGGRRRDGRYSTMGRKREIARWTDIFAKGERGNDEREKKKGREEKAGPD